MTSTGAIHLHDVTVSYDHRVAVTGVSGTFEAGSLTAIAGPNGAGKSTLLRTIMGEITPDRGRVDLGGLNRRDVAYLPQGAEIDRHFPLCVADVVLLGSWRAFGAFGRMAQRDATRAAQALAAVGLEGLERRRIDTLSSGQWQRVLFARLLLQHARVILLDEPFTAIDSRTVHDLLRIIDQWHREGRTVIAVLHDFDQVRRHFPDTLLLAREVIAWDATARSLSASHLLQAHTMAQRWDEISSSDAPAARHAA